MIQSISLGADSHAVRAGRDLVAREVGARSRLRPRAVDLAFTAALPQRLLVARKWDYATRRFPGRPSTAVAIRKLVIRIATENPRGDTGGCRAS